MSDYQDKRSAYSVYVHTYPGTEVYANRQEDKAVIHVDELAIIIRDVRTAEKLVNAANAALDILQDVAP